MKEKLAVIGALILIIGTCFAVYFYFEKRYCLAEDFQRFAQSTKYELKSNQIEKDNERVWQLQREIRNDPQNEPAREQLQREEETKKRHEKELDELGKVK